MDEESDGKEQDEADECVDRKTSAVYLHLLSRPDCLSVYDDSHFSVLCFARSVQQLKVLEAVCVRIDEPRQPHRHIDPTPLCFVVQCHFSCPLPLIISRAVFSSIKIKKLIKSHKPVLCKQKEHVVALRLYS